MSKIIFAFIGVALYFAVGHALQCYDCKLGLWNLCITSKTTCADGQQCYSGIGKAGGFVDIKMKGCLDVSKCNKTETTNFPTNTSTGTVYQMTKTCCVTDLCNSALGHVHLSAVSMALTTITSVVIVKLLI